MTRALALALLIAASDLLIPAAAPAQAASKYKPCPESVASDGFPNFGQVRAKRMACSTVRIWLESVDEELDQAFDLGEDPAGRYVLRSGGGRIAYRCTSRMRQGDPNPYLADKCISVDRRKAFVFNAGS